jgi:hypothetical protein
MPRSAFILKSAHPDWPGSGSESGRGSVSGDSADTNGDQLSNTTTNSTLQTSLHSSTSTDSWSGSFVGSASGSGSEPSSVSSSNQTRPLVDTRQKYKGFSFVFATDDRHDTETVYGNGYEDCIHYLKPTRMDDSSYPPVMPYFFIGFDWKDVDGQQCAVGPSEVSG